jgi:hypothetical protein
MCMNLYILDYILCVHVFVYLLIELFIWLVHIYVIIYFVFKYVDLCLYIYVFNILQKNSPFEIGLRAKLFVPEAGKNIE